MKTNTIFIGKVLINLKEIDSTSENMQKRLLSEKLVEGTIIQADYQSAGKGQRNNNWESERGKNLLCSILLKPHFLHPRNTFFLNKITSLAVLDTLNELTEQEVKIKWPNDVWIKEQKIAGILINNALMGNTLKSSIIGIGINVNQLIFRTPNLNATSLKILEGKDFSNTNLLKRLAFHLETRYLQLKAGQVEGISADYRKALLGLNESRHFKEAGSDNIFAGQIRGVNGLGQLIVKRSDGVINHYNNKEIIFISKKNSSF